MALFKTSRHLFCAAIIVLTLHQVRNFLPRQMARSFSASLRIPGRFQVSQPQHLALQRVRKSGHGGLNLGHLSAVCLYDGSNFPGVLLRPAAAWGRPFPVHLLKCDQPLQPDAHFQPKPGVSFQPGFASSLVMFSPTFSDILAGEGCSHPGGSIKCSAQPAAGRLFLRG